MLLHPYFLDDLVHQRQAGFLAEAENDATVAEALRARKAAIVQRLPRQVRIVRTPGWSSRQAKRTDMAA
jgi:hypothetical protein